MVDSIRIVIIEPGRFLLQNGDCSFSYRNRFPTNENNTFFLKNPYKFFCVFTEITMFFPRFLNNWINFKNH